LGWLSPLLYSGLLSGTPPRMTYESFADQHCTRLSRFVSNLDEDEDFVRYLRGLLRLETHVRVVVHLVVYLYEKIKAA
jgi:hypothetical protein